MPKSTSVALDDHLIAFMDEALRGALFEGEQSGPSEPFDFDAFIQGRRSADR